VNDDVPRLGSQAPRNPHAAAEFVPYALPRPHLYPFEMELSHVVSSSRLGEAVRAGHYRGYLLGDVGGVISPEPQRAVAAAMRALSPDALRYDPDAAPWGDTLFSYIVGDVVYYNGERGYYRAQFYEPYQGYGRPILAIPGNHDGSLDDDTVDGPRPGASLEGFIANFCAPERGIAADAGGLCAHTMDQPNVYWTLEAPWLRVVGLYTNVPEGGMVEDRQQRWFLSQMERPRGDKHLIVALHQPVFSADAAHGGSPDMLDLVHEPARRAGCRLVLSGHVHNYQRFIYYDVNYLVIGGGGFFEMHDIEPPAFPGALYPVVAETRQNSFVHVSVTPRRLTLRVVGVPLPFDPYTCVPRLIDTVEIEL
jgi:hypothetical protein